MVKRLKRAFTITELVIVIAVIAILAAVLIPTLSNVMSSANKSAALSTCRNALTNLEGVYAEDGKTASDLDGTVFVSDGYAYVFLNSSLQYIGELEDLAGVSASGTATGSATYTITYSGSGSSTDSSTLTLTKGTSYTQLKWGETVIYFSGAVVYSYDKNGKQTYTSSEIVSYAYADTESNHYYTGVDKLETADTHSYSETTELSTKSAETLYIYEIEVNSTTYYGFFTYEASDALYQTEAATYSRLQAYSSKSITSTTEVASSIKVDIGFTEDTASQSGD